MRTFGVLALALLLLPGCSSPDTSGAGGDLATPSGGPSDPDCPTQDYRHYHPSFQVYLEGERLPFTNASFRQFSVEKGFHIHGDDGILHIEPFDGRCFGFSTILGHLGIEATEAAIMLHEEHGERAGTYPAADGEMVAAFHKTYHGEWEAIGVLQLNARVIHPGERVLLTYGPLDAETIAAQQAAVPEPREPFPGA